MTRILLLIVCTLTFASCTSADKQEARRYEQGEELELIGTIAGARCFAENSENIGNDHNRPEGFIKGCGTTCATLGLPVAVVEGGTKDGKVWVLLTNSQAMADYIAAPVRVSGIVRDEGILIPTRIELKTSDGWTIIL